jgi:hypothetical protein
MELKTVKRYIISVFGFIISIIVFVILKQLFLTAPSFDEVLKNDAKEINKSCPIMVDETTRLDNAIALPNRTFQMNYTITSAYKALINIIEFEKTMRPIILTGLKNNPDLKNIHGKNVTMVYNFKDCNGEFISNITFKPDEYDK